MANYFNGINIGYKALMAQKTSLDVVGHNVANANTEGYSRQRAVHSASIPHPLPGLYTPAGAGQLGTGVEISQIQRIKDEFIEAQINEEEQGKGYWEKVQEGMYRIEMIFNEPSESSLSNALSLFWQSLQDLSNQPQDPATRETVRQQGENLVDTFHTIYDQLDDYQRSLNLDISSKVEQINSLARRIADLNRQIVSIKGSGMEPNDLLDKRDTLFTELNRLVNAQKQLDSQGNMHISIGGVGLVAGVEVRKLAVVEPELTTGRYQDQVVFADTGEKAIIESGELAGIIHIRDVEINIYKGELDRMAEGFLSRFNEVHRTGYNLNGSQGVDFFAVKDGFNSAAVGITLSEAILADINNIASGNYSDNPAVVVVENISGSAADSYQVVVSPGAGEALDYEVYDSSGALIAQGSANPDQAVDLISEAGIILYLRSAGEASINLLGNPGSGANAIALADAIKKEEVVDNASIADYYETIIAKLGVTAQRANQMVNNQSLLVEQLKNQQASISGVSLDEEMANMIKYQHAYQAAAKIINTTDRILETLLGIIR